MTFKVGDYTKSPNGEEMFDIDDIWGDEKKIGKCEVCGAKNVEVFASGFHVAFVCEKCLI